MVELRVEPRRRCPHFNDMTTAALTERGCVQLDASGKPIIPLTPSAVYRFGHLIRLSESLLLKLFSEGRELHTPAWGRRCARCRWYERATIRTIMSCQIAATTVIFSPTRAIFLD